MRSFLSRYNSSQPGQSNSQHSGQQQDMGWRSLAVNVGSTVKRVAKSAYEGGYEKMVTLRDSETIKQWRERRTEEVKGVEKITLFPGYAVKRLHDSPQRQNEFSIDIYVDGYASSLRPPELATRSQKAFMRLAKGFAALPKLPASDGVGPTLVPDVDDARSVRSFKDDDASDAEDMPELSNHLPPRPDQMDDRLEEAVLAHDPRAMNTSPGALNSPPRDSPVAAGFGPSWENLSHSELTILHTNLDTRLQPFWSSILPNRTVRLSVFVSEHKEQASTPSSDPEDLKPEPLVVAEVQTNPQGYFSQRWRVSFDDICTHPPALPIAFGDPLVEHYLVIKADLLPPEVPGVNQSVNNLLDVSDDGRPPSPAMSVRSTRSDRTPQPNRTLQIPASTSASFSAPATPPHLYQQPSASVSQTSIRPAPSVETLIPITSAKVRLISDIDDTVKQTDVLLGLKAIYRNVFVRGLSDLVVPGMADWYSAMARRGVHFHYVSNSPFELLPVLQEFFSVAGLPHGSVRLRYYGGRSMLNGLWSGAGDRKRGGIIEVLDAFPDSQFILVGDTGEQDLELYGTIARERPEQILALFLRDVSTTGPPVDVPDILRDVARLEQSRAAEPTYFPPSSPPTRQSTLPAKVRDIPPPPVRKMSARQGSTDTTSTVYGSGPVPYRPRTPSRKSTSTSDMGVLSTSPATRSAFAATHTSEPLEMKTSVPYGVQTRAPPNDPRSPSQRLPGAYRPAPVHRSSTSVSSTTGQDPVYELEERRRNELRTRVLAVREMTPAHIYIKIFRDPAECDEAFRLLDNLGLKERQKR